MPTLLQINTSLFGQQGQSSQLARHFVSLWRQQHPDGRVVVRDLAKEPLPHLSAERFQALLTKAEERTAAQRDHVAVSDTLIDELKQADIVVMGLPMYNFGVPSHLKAWIDHIARAGITFKYTQTGAVGLLPDRKVILTAARGGHYLGTAKDTQTPYIETFFNFIGIKDIEFVYAEGLAMGDDVKHKALADARNAIDRLVETMESAAA